MRSLKNINIFHFLVAENLFTYSISSVNVENENKAAELADAPTAACRSRLELIFPDLLYEVFYANFC
jgi:hypothetical protein